MGTITTWKLFKSVCGAAPGKMGKEVSEDRVETSAAQLSKLQKLARGPWKEQFSTDRLADAMDVCKKDWAHFNRSTGALPKTRQMMPTALAVIMAKRACDGWGGSPHQRLLCPRFPLGSQRPQVPLPRIGALSLAEARSHSSSRGITTWHPYMMSAQGLG